jgi:hypothetical protein
VPHWHAYCVRIVQVYLAGTRRFGPRCPVSIPITMAGLSRKPGGCLLAIDAWSVALRRSHIGCCSKWGLSRLISLVSSCCASTGPQVSSAGPVLNFTILTRYGVIHALGCILRCVLCPERYSVARKSDGPLAGGWGFQTPPATFAMHW